ncbi:GntR family transcriptional regulator [Conexibacter sp. JD483]|uniref:GntR family transcriptional regulator n=1 Tax=unclassified Conexibacter TaxID=2627773 RepID=UPI0027252079|nr:MULTISPECIES: GntR family transcriptional regulator [unclassified Conexibacter]MDO8187870.1 GntR family transcriptional regulator [Conexibacter sp. CPCC 205706]MDO8201222.1 GntR family transcriptional regulator [Conexibacter sp. CPCC 205762]MDR9369766.1 GntR family transcriptional regulator [Conexibacter sp. JD483]
MRQQVAETLRSAIIHGELNPGDRLREEDLSDQLDMSRGPIREALRQLEQEGLVASFPYRGTVVADVWGDEVLAVLVPIRATLELYALRHALRRFEEPDFNALGAIVDEMQTAAETGNLARVIELDMAFHRLILERSELFHSLQLWEMISPRMRGLFYRMGPHHTSLQEIAEQHRELLAALRSGDEQLAYATLEEHIAEPRLYARLPRGPEPHSAAGDDDAR